MILSPDITALVLKALDSVISANNGYADIGNNDDVAHAVSLAGFTVIRTVNLHGNPVYRAFTQAAQDALRVSAFGVSTYKPVSPIEDGPDYEGAILDRQAAYLFE